MTITAQTWYKVGLAIEDGAVGYAFDGCHKIYVLMDEAQYELMEEYGYGEENVDYLVRASEDSVRDLEMLKAWFEDSCGLRFISAVRTVEGDPNEGFTDLIAQFSDEVF